MSRLPPTTSGAHENARSGEKKDRSLP
jgi:hypothetical protein